jgi:hypothetical protein
MPMSASPRCCPDTLQSPKEEAMPWRECSVMDERLQFVARRLADGGTLQGVWDLSQDRLQYS